MPSRQPFQPDPKPKPTILFLSITIFSSLIILFAILYFLYYLWYSLIHRSRTSPFDSGSPSPFVKLHRFTYKELKSATHGFNCDNSIGKGGSGTVYRGILKDGKLVAIKLLDSGDFQCEREFQNELQVLGGLKSSFVVSLLGYCVEKSNRLVVYEYLPNRSLQESLFSDSLNLNWGRRFEIVLDISRALAFLHLECDPPVIHGDVKPSNVLLDSEFRAKISDFGLSRLKIEGEFGVDFFSQDLWKSQDLSGNLAGIGGEITQSQTSRTPDSPKEVDFALALQASSSSKNNKIVSHHVRGLSSNSLNHNSNLIYENDCKNVNVKGKEVFSFEYGGEEWNDESFSHEHSRELNSNDDIIAGKKQWGKDWWWKQDGSGELCSKDYVTEWIGSQISPSANPDWDEEKKTSPRKPYLDNSRLDKFVDANETLYQAPGIECTNKGIETDELREWRQSKRKHRKMQEWWKEEHLDELKKKGNKRLNKIEKKCRKGFKIPRRWLRIWRRRKSTQFDPNECCDPETEFSFRKTSKKKKTFSGGSEMWSGDLFSRELSSTTSMRGTLCYVAPEYGGCGYLMEKADIYSLGVLILVIISGRRPLHVLASPMKLEKANLISWCRQLAQGGDLLELVDERLKGEYNKEQATLCINLALACLQRMPEMRPDIGDIVKILRGEMDLPPQPFEFSPSPPSRLFSRSRRKHKVNAE